MAYNNFFPTGYQPYTVVPTQQPQAQPQNTQTAQQGNRIYVQGEESAKSYLVAPNSSVVLWDIESPTIYLKSADASGIPSMRVFDYKERGVQEPTPTVAYATKEDIEMLHAEIEKLKTKETKEKKK